MSYALKNGKGNTFSCKNNSSQNEWVIQVNDEPPFKTNDFDAAIGYLEKRRNELKEK